MIATLAAALLGYLWMPAVVGLTCLPLMAVLPSAPPLYDDAPPPRPLFPWHWRIGITITIARKEHSTS